MKAEDLERRLELLRGEQSPTRDLWPGIERSILEPGGAREKRPDPWRRRAVGLVAAAACLALALGGILFAVRRPSLDLRGPGVAGVSEAERQYEAARDQLLVSLRELAAHYGQSSLPYERELAAIDERVKALKQTAAGDPVDYTPALELGQAYRSYTASFENALALVYRVADRKEQ